MPRIKLSEAKIFILLRDKYLEPPSKKRLISTESAFFLFISAMQTGSETSG